jgi:hypothetical protein
MNPLVNTELQAYVKELIDQNFPGKDDEDQDPVASPKVLHKRSGDKAQSTGDEKAKRADRA